MFLLHSRCFLFFILLVISMTCCIPFSYSSHDSEFEYEKQVLLKLKQQLLTSPSVQTWNTFCDHPCTWIGIQCTNNNSITGISLPEENINATIPTIICNLPNLTFLDLSFNPNPGGFPTYLYNCTKLQTLDLSSNNFKGPLPTDIYKLSNLEHLDIRYNGFTGDIPSSIGQLTKLTYLAFSHNSFNETFPSEIGNLTNLETLSIGPNLLLVSRVIPMEFSRLKKLSYLYMSNCNLIGYIPPSFANLSSLKELDLSSNNLVGDIPGTLFQFKNLSMLYLYGNQLSGEISIVIHAINYVDFGKLQKLETLYLYKNQLSGPIPASFANLSSLKYLDIHGNKLVGPIPADLGKFDYVDMLGNKLCSNNKIFNVPTCSSSRNKYVILITTIGGSVFILIVFVTTFFKTFWHGKENQSSEQLTWEMKTFHKLEFTKTEIVSSLIEDNVIGSGGSGKVYRIDLNDASNKVAVKKILNIIKSKDSLEKQFISEVEILGRIRHVNIVKLLCYISRENTQLLVYEYMENGSLDNWLHVSQESSMLLDWPTRLQIAIGAAKGLSYMHHGCSPPIIHRDVKSSNILLDSEFNAKVADFGLAKISISSTGEPYTASVIAGTFGYIAPEYSRTRRLNEKIDVYSFGVVLLELATGKEPRSGNEYMNLADWSRQQYYDEEFPIEDALDDRIKEPCYLEEMVNVFKLGVMCTCPIPFSRPSMRQVSELLISFNHRQDSNSTLTESGEEEDVLSIVSIESHILAP